MWKSRPGKIAGFLKQQAKRILGRIYGFFQKIRKPKNNVSSEFYHPLDYNLKDFEHKSELLDLLFDEYFGKYGALDITSPKSLFGILKEFIKDSKNYDLHPFIEEHEGIALQYLLDLVTHFNRVMVGDNHQTFHIFISFTQKTWVDKLKRSNKYDSKYESLGIIEHLDYIFVKEFEEKDIENDHILYGDYMDVLLALFKIYSHCYIFFFNDRIINSDKPVELCEGFVFCMLIFDRFFINNLQNLKLQREINESLNQSNNYLNSIIENLEGMVEEGIRIFENEPEYTKMCKDSIVEIKEKKETKNKENQINDEDFE